VINLRPSPPPRFSILPPKSSYLLNESPFFPSPLKEYGATLQERAPGRKFPLEETCLFHEAFRPTTIEWSLFPSSPFRGLQLSAIKAQPFFFVKLRRLHGVNLFSFPSPFPPFFANPCGATLFFFLQGRTNICLRLEEIVLIHPSLFFPP